MPAVKERKIKRRKAIRKDEAIRIRLSAEQKKALTDAATKKGLGVSSWLLMLGLREIEQEKRLGN